MRITVINILIPVRPTLASGSMIGIISLYSTCSANLETILNSDSHYVTSTTIHNAMVLSYYIDVGAKLIEWLIREIEQNLKSSNFISGDNCL